MGRDTEHDLGRLLVMLGSLAALVAGIVLAFTTAWWWVMVGVAVLLFGVSVTPKDVPAYVGGRWDWPQGVTQGIGIGAVPLGVAAAVEWAWWWIVIAAGVLVAAALVSRELDMRSGKHARR
jgi:hypothetical protein